MNDSKNGSKTTHDFKNERLRILWLTNYWNEDFAFISDRKFGYVFKVKGNHDSS